MNTRFGLNTFALVASGFLAVVSRTLGQTPLEWTGFGVSAALVLAAVAGLTTTGRRGLVNYGTLGVVSAWSLVAALTFTGTALTWLVLADALAVAGVALAALVAHEVTTERVVHTLEIRDHELQAA